MTRDLAVDELAQAVAAHLRPADFAEPNDDELRLDLRDRSLFVAGEINMTAYDDVEQALDANPNVRTLVFTRVPGSSEDDVNVEIGRMIRARGLTTYLPARGVVASGGTDLFLSGARRVVLLMSSS